MTRAWAGSWVVLAGVFLGACSAKASPFKSVTLCDFERIADPLSESPHYDIPTALKKPNYTNHDFRWGTSGYSEMQPTTKQEARAAKNKPLYKYFQGKTAAKVRFTVPSDYKKKGAEAPKKWETGISLATDTYTALPVTDWSPFRYLALEAYNPGEKDQTLHLRIADSSANVTETALAVVAGGPSTLEVDLLMLSSSRVNAKDIRSLTLYLDTANQDRDPYLIFDNLGLHTATVEERRKAESEEGDEADEEEEDWDEEEEEGVIKTGVISRPSGVTGKMPAEAAPAGR